MLNLMLNTIHVWSISIAVLVASTRHMSLYRECLSDQLLLIGKHSLVVVGFIREWSWLKISAKKLFEIDPTALKIMLRYSTFLLLPNYGAKLKKSEC